MLNNSPIIISTSNELYTPNAAQTNIFMSFQTTAPKEIEGAKMMSENKKFAILSTVSIGRNIADLYTHQYGDADFARRVSYCTSIVGDAINLTAEFLNNPIKGGIMAITSSIESALQIRRENMRLQRVNANAVDAQISTNTNLNINRYI